MIEVLSCVCIEPRYPDTPWLAMKTGETISRMATMAGASVPDHQSCCFGSHCPLRHPTHGGEGFPVHVQNMKGGRSAGKARVLLAYPIGRDCAVGNRVRTNASVFRISTFSQKFRRLNPHTRMANFRIAKVTSRRWIVSDSTPRTIPLLSSTDKG